MFSKIFRPSQLRLIALAWLLPAMLLTACSGFKTSTPQEEEEPVSFLTGKSGGFKLSDIGKNTGASDGMPVNALLWRAALDIASFVPLDDVDTFGGSIITEWYQKQDKPNERLKLSMFVVGRELRSDAITVRAYLQARQGNGWVDAGRDEALARQLEDLVLARAREMRAAALSETVK
tara:strand:+ start:647 stop:1177 length:531 start_codon:yes stop_codon:yes gene_type:complete